MATDHSAHAADAAPAASGGVKKHLPFVLALVGGLALGGAGGALFVGPAMARGIAPAAASAAGDTAVASDDDEHEATTEKKKEGEGPAKNVHTLDNLVLNPAGSNGTRFLLLTIALEVKNESVLEEMKTRDAELRDAVLATLGGKSVEQLAEMSARDALKDELRDVAAKLFKPGAVKRVYFPQFVIQ